MSHNYVREWREFEHLTELPCLEDLVFIGNPLEEDASANGKYQEEVTKVRTCKIRYLVSQLFKTLYFTQLSATQNILEATLLKEVGWLPSYSKC